MKWILLLLLLTISLAHAQGPDQEYIRIYNLISQADAMSASTNVNNRLAVDQYRQAHAALKKLQSIYPQWNRDVVKFRLNYVAEKLQQLPQTPATNAAPVKTGTTSATAQPSWVEEIRRLQADKALLEAKLKEALSVRPSGTTSSEVTKLEEKLVAVQKERDLLKVALEQASESKNGEANTESALVRQLERERDDLKKRLAALESQNGRSPRSDNKEIEQLRARLEVLEARPEPFSAEELALFRQTPPLLAPAETTTPAKKSKELPAGSGALVAQAERAFAARRFEEAEDKYLQVLRQDEDNVYILGNLAAIQLEMNNVAAAEKNINRALAEDPNDAFSLTLLGMINFRENKFDEALDALSRSAKIDPNNPETQNYLGITLSQKGQRAAAEAALRKAIQVQPNYGGAHHNLAVIYATQKPPFLELARWHYEKALALGHPKNSDLEKLVGADK